MANYRRELRIGVDIGEKEKSGKSNQVCRENEKISTRESWSSTKKSIRKNEETSRKMEERG